MKSSITKRWVRGSLLFTLAIILLAEGGLLYFTITGYYEDVRAAIETQLIGLQSQLSSSASEDEKNLRLIRSVEQFDRKSQFELMLVNSDMSIDATSSGIIPVYSEVPIDIQAAMEPASSGYAEYVGDNETGEKVMAVTMMIPQYAAADVVALRLVTGITQVDIAIANVIAMSVVILLAIFLASVISGIYFIRSIVYPLQKLEMTAAKIAKGEFDTRILNDSQDEVGQLCRTINNMAEELSQTERMKNEFISSVSHELRTPLTSIQGWTDTMRQLKDPSDVSFQKGLDIISGESQRLYDMVEDLLDFSRIQDGLNLHTELLDLAAEVEDAVLLVTRRAANVQVEVIYDAPELPVAIEGDKNRIRQVMVNVLDNAIKYSFTKGKVYVNIKEENDIASVTVKDEGRGISAEDIELVKQKFYKGKGALRGSGIGLAVVDEIMKGHGGTLNIESENNDGTQVEICFPMYKYKTKE